ncbi:MAG: hypothetical protein COT74_06840 [Bdellovibrionales bacterium CG10_big_fil_rev_8_21_14_0_10_45_34]|nr:MAG: hypothetical protein COT74_06840 [Bdellovibrionales bacterium CG10_big_fil_rev_8_21_14_0_10_45_34]
MKASKRNFTLAATVIGLIITQGLAIAQSADADIHRDTASISEGVSSNDTVNLTGVESASDISQRVDDLSRNEKIRQHNLYLQRIDSRSSGRN